MQGWGMRRLRAPGLRLVQLCACSPGPQADSNSGFHFSCRRRGGQICPYLWDPGCPAAMEMISRRHVGPELCSQCPCTQVWWPQLADPTSPSLGKPGTAARAERRASPALPHPGPTTPRANNAPLWQLISHRQTACGSCRDLVNKEQRHKLSRGGGGCGLSWGEGGAHSPQMGEWVPVILSETKGDASLPAGQLPSPLGRRACRTLLSLQGMCCPLEKKESIQKSISTCQRVHPC